MHIDKAVKCWTIQFRGVSWQRTFNTEHAAWDYALTYGELKTKWFPAGYLEKRKQEFIDHGYMAVETKWGYENYATFS